MINFIDEFAKLIDVPFDEVIKDYSYLVVGGRIIYITNYLKIVTYSLTDISLKVKGGVLHISGSDLTLKELDKHSITIIGNITSVNME